MAEMGLQRFEILSRSATLPSYLSVKSPILSPNSRSTRYLSAM